MLEPRAGGISIGQDAEHVVAAQLGLEEVGVCLGPNVGRDLGRSPQLSAAVAVARPGKSGHRNANAVEPIGEDDVRVAHEDQRPDVRIAQLVAGDDGDAGFGDRFGSKRNFDRRRGSGSVEAIDVVGKAEQRRSPVRLGVGAYAFERPEAIVEGMGQRVYRRLVPGLQRPVHPDSRDSLNHGSSPFMSRMAGQFDSLAHVQGHGARLC